MHPRAQELLNYLEQQRQSLRDAVAAVPSHQHTQPPADGAWSVVQVLEHLAIVEGRIAAVTRKTVEEARAAGVGLETDESPVVPTLPLKAVLDRTVKRVASEASQPKTLDSIESAWQALEASRASLRDVLVGAHDLAWRQIVAPHPVLGPTDLNTWFGFVAAHEARHTAQIREIAASFAGAS